LRAHFELGLSTEDLSHIESGLAVSLSPEN